ncbi:MAG: hypothetical protein Q9225_007134 [Loekoesia sp. 1 TL-2023]
MDTYATITIIVAVLSAIGAAVYMTDAGNDMVQWMAERFFKAKAKAEEKALEHAGAEKAQDFLKDQLKKNPVMSNEELDQIYGGLGEEAKECEGKGGLGAMLGR